MGMFQGGWRAKLSSLVGAVALIGSGFAFSSGTLPAPRSRAAHRSRSDTS